MTYDRACTSVHRMLDRGVDSRRMLLAGLTANHRQYLDAVLIDFSNRGWLSPAGSWQGPPFTGPTQWGERNSYRAIHLRLRKERGRASDQTCPCGQPAVNWSYDGGDPDERYSIVKSDRPTKRRYSIDLARYTARCYSCHARLDHSSPA